MSIAEITTRIVRVIEVPRSLLGDFLKMPEAEQIGVYFLFGEDEDGGAPSCYIGQTGSLKTRLSQHNAGKDFWNRAIIAVSLTNSLANTHASYLEWLSIQQAQTAGRYVMDNGNAGGRPYTPAPMEDCSEIHATVRTLLATLGFPVFEPLARAEVVQRGDEVFVCRVSDAEARGLYTKEGFVVLAGSSGRMGAAGRSGSARRRCQRREAYGPHITGRSAVRLSRQASRVSAVSSWPGSSGSGTRC